MTPAGAADPGGLLAFRRYLERSGGADRSPRETLRDTRKARHVKAALIEQPRALETEVIEADTAANLQSALASWLAGAGSGVDVIEIDHGVAAVWDGSATRTVFSGLVTYAPDDDRQTFETALLDWFKGAEEKDFIELQFEHTDRVYRALILYAE